MKPVLVFPIKGRWFQMIKSGEKPEEYRDDTPYYEARLAKYEGKIICVWFRNGYRRDSPTLEAAVVPVRRKGAKPEWGGDPDKLCWVLEIQEVHDAEVH